VTSIPEHNEYYNSHAKGVSYFTPAQDPPAVTLVKVPEGRKEPNLFTPLKMSRHGHADLLEQGLDIVTIVRAFQKNPSLVFTWAGGHGVTVQMQSQIRHAFVDRGKPGQKAPNRPQLDSY
jgi:hypothetical protein